MSYISLSHFLKTEGERKKVITQLSGFCNETKPRKIFPLIKSFWACLNFKWEFLQPSKYSIETFVLFTTSCITEILDTIFLPVCEVMNHYVTCYVFY